MLARLRPSILIACIGLVGACSAWAQTTTLEGNVTDPNGQALKGAVIQLNRTDIKGHYSVKSDKKGHWLYTGLPMGTYDVSCEVDGKQMDQVKGVQSKYGDSTTVDFDLRKVQQQQAAAAQANNSGQLTQDQSRGMSKEQKEQYEAQMKQRAEAMKKNSALNDAYNAGDAAMKQAQAEPDKTKKGPLYQTAIDNFKKAGELDATQVAVWDGLGEAYSGLAATQTGDDRMKSYDLQSSPIRKAWQSSLMMRPFTTRWGTSTEQKRRFRKRPKL